MLGPGGCMSYSCYDGVEGLRLVEAQDNVAQPWADLKVKLGQNMLV